jgi:HEAT repeat protein
MNPDDVRNAKALDGPTTARDPHGKYQETYHNSWALVVGINEYENLTPLHYAKNDAQAVADLLKTEYGFKDEHVFLRVDSKATKDEIEQLIETFIEETQPDDRVLIYFAGHGGTRTYPSGKKEGYLAPVKAVKKGWHTSIPINSLTGMISNAAAKHIFCVFDACFSGLVFTRADGLSSNQYQRDLLKRSARLALTAGLEDQEVSDGSGVDDHSIFTHYLLRGLRGEARQGPDGILTGLDLMNYVYGRVRAHPGSVQTPSWGRLPPDDSGDFLFISTAARLPMEIESDLKHMYVQFRKRGLEKLGEPLEPRNEEMLRIQVETLADYLTSDDLSEAREQAAKSLLQLAAPQSFTSLVQALFERDEKMTPAVRKMIVLAIGELNNVGAVDHLVRALLNDVDPQVQEATAQVLGRLKSRQASGALCEALRANSDPLVRRAAAQALHRLADPDTFDALVKALEDMEPEVRSWATQALAQLHNERAVYALSKIMLNDPEPKVRSWAAQALGRLEDTRAVAALMIDLEYDPDANVRSDTLRNLGNFRRLNFIDFITKALRDPEAQVRLEAVRVLGTLHHPRAVGPLARALHEDSEPSVRQASAEALSAFRFPEVAEVLIRALSDNDTNVRRYTVQSLAKLGAKNAAGPLVKMLRDDREDSKVRRLAATALGELEGIEDGGVVDALFSALQDRTLQDPEMRLAATLSLGRLGDNRAVPYLTEAIQNGDADVRHNAINVVGELEVPQIADVLRHVLEHDTEENVCIAAAEALGKLVPAAQETKDLLAKVMRKDRRIKVRAIAAVSLGSLRDTHYLQALTEVLEEEDEGEIVRSGAAVGLGIMGDGAVLTTLSAALNAPSDKVKLGAIVGMGYLNDTAVVEPLARFLLEKAVDPIIRQKAAQQLLELKHPGTLDSFLTAMDSEPEPLILRTLVAGLGQLEGAKGNKTVIATLLKILRENALPEVRQAAVSALGNVGDECTVGPLVESLRDQNPTVAAWAVAALGKLEARQARDELRSVYMHNERLQVWAAWAAGRMQDDEALGLFEV